LPNVEEDVCPVDVREGVAVGEVARRLEDREGLFDPPELGACLGPGEQGAELEVGILDRAQLFGPPEPGDRLLELARGDRRLCARDESRRLLVLRRREARLEEAARDAEPLGKPLERRVVRTDPAALDLADVLLREAAEAELRLRQAARDAQLANAFANRGLSRPVGRRMTERRRDA
jgi:hypothetical protein